MKERPTPETDAEHAQFAMGGFTLDFCRKMERERDEAREDARTLADATKRLLKQCNEAREEWGKASMDAAQLLSEKTKVMVELDEAREALSGRTVSCSQCNETAKQLEAMERAGAEQARRADENREWALRAERERDEAREVASGLAKQAERIRKERDEARKEAEYHKARYDLLKESW